MVDKVEKQVKKFREKRKEHSNYGNVSRNRIGELAEVEDVSGSGDVDLVRLNNCLPKPMTIDDAVKHLEFSGKDVLLFLNYETNKYNVVCMLKDGRVGFIEP